VRRARPITAIVLATAVSATALLAPAATTATATVAPLISPACLHAYEHERLAHPRLSDGAPPTALTSILGVLRRPATPADALTQSQLPNVFYSQLWIKSVRLLEIGADGVRYYLVPGIFDHPRPAACLLDLPAAERHADQLEDRQQRLGSVTVDATAPDIANSPALTRQAIEQGSPSFGLPSVTSSSAPIYGIVPDGVSTVVITVASGRPVVGAVVTNNFYVATVPFNHDASNQTFTVQWLAAGGATLKTIRVRLEKITGPSVTIGV